MKSSKYSGVKLLGAALCVMLAMTMLSACGGGGRADAELEGNYISVAGTAMGFTLSGEDMEGFDIELQAKGKAKMVISGEEYSGVKWTNDDTTITMKVSGKEIVGELGTDTITFTDLLGMGMDLTFAKEGTDAAKPENYLPEEEKFLLGKWQSYKVTDVLGNDVSDQVSPDWITAEFTGDHNAVITVDGEASDPLKWTLYSGFGSFEPDYGFSLNVVGEEIELVYSDDEDYFVTTCQKAE